MRKAYRPVMGVASDGWLILLPLAALTGTTMVSGDWVTSGLPVSYTHLTLPTIYSV